MDTSESPPTADDFEAHLKAAHLLRNDFAARLIFVPNLGWHGWDGTRWVQDEYAAQRCLYELALRVRATDNDIYKLLNKGKNISIISQLAEPLLERPVSELDADPYLLNTPCGVVDLRDGSTHPHDPRYLMTKITNGSYVQQSSTLADTFYKEVLPDDDERRYMQQLCGLAVYGGVRERIFPIIWGSGKNGKTTFLEAMLFAFGDYGVKLDTEVILAGKAHDEKKLELRGARFALVSETDTGARLKMSLIKEATSASTMTARPLYKKVVKWRVSHTFFNDTNHLPRVNGSDKAVFDRIRVVKFGEDFSDREVKNLDETLCKDADAFITFAVDGWLDYQENGLIEPVSVLAETQAYQESTDTIGRWLGEQTLRADDSTPRTKLYHWYKGYCYGEHIEEADIISAADFYVALERRGYRPATVHGERFFKGIKLAYPAPADES